MIEELKIIENLVFRSKGYKISNLIEEKESTEYFGFNFQVEHLKIKFRKAKVTPKKVGQFVTLWKRNSEKLSVPFDVNDDFNFYLVFTNYESKCGFFMFPKQILSEQRILTNNHKKGKRGFRVYPTWTDTENKQAEKAQLWQTKYFIDLTNQELENVDICNEIIRIKK